MLFRASACAFALVLAAGEARAEVCVRPTDPAGALGYDYGADPVAHFDTARTRVWYTVLGKHAVRPASTRTDDVPDDVAHVGEVTEDALSAYATMGFRAPVSDADPTCGSNGGDARLDVYLVHFTAADGTTVTERCKSIGAATQCASWILAEATFDTGYTTVDEGIRTVLPHEVFHAVQNAYDVGIDRFWAEGTAQWAARTLAPSLRDLERFLPAFFAEEGRSIDVPPGGVTAGYLYGAAIWPVFLAHRFDPAIIREILEEEAASGASALDAARVAIGNRGSALDDAWPTFWTWNASTGARADGTGYPDASLYPLLPTRELVDVVSDVTSGSTAYVYHLARSSRVEVTLETDGAHRARLLPIEDGKVVLAKAAPLPAMMEGEALVVITSLATSKADAPYTVRVTAKENTPAAVTPAPASRSGGGCATRGAMRTGRGDTGWALAAVAVLALARRKSSAVRKLNRS